jgi:hypothetical protein
MFSHTLQDGRTCNAIQIGTQAWMAEKLKVSTFRNGNAIGITDLSTISISNEINP